MSDPLRLTLVGASGLVGRSVIDLTAFDPRFRLSALVRRAFPLPKGARIEVLVVDPANWRDALGHFEPQVVVCALGTTWAKSGKSEEAFRAVDHDLVLEVAAAARAQEARHFIYVSSVGADMASKNFYLRTKGEVEQALGKLKFKRLDILRPGLLRGEREGDRRVLERLGILAAPVTDLFLHGGARKYRSIKADMLARAIASLASEKAAGRFVHEHDELKRAAGRLDRELERRQR